MAKARKDHRGRALRKGEIQRKDMSYMYSYTDPYGKRRYIYANDLVGLREKEKKLMKDQLDGLDVYAAEMPMLFCILFRLLKINPRTQIKFPAEKMLFSVCAENARKIPMWRHRLKK